VPLDPHLARLARVVVFLKDARERERAAALMRARHGIATLPATSALHLVALARGAQAERAIVEIRKRDADLRTLSELAFMQTPLSLFVMGPVGDHAFLNELRRAGVEAQALQPDLALDELCDVVAWHM
jgi:hypothetical protein